MLLVLYASPYPVASLCYLCLHVSRRLFNGEWASALFRSLLQPAPWSGTSNGTPREGGGTTFTAQGWKPGDKASWEAQLTTRAQNGQNEYNRTQ